MWIGFFKNIFITFIYLYTIDTFIHHSFVNIRWGPSSYLHSCRLSGWNLHGVPSWDSNSGLPYSKPARYQLSHTAPSAEPHCTLDVNCEGSYQGKLSSPSLVYYFCSCIIGQLVTINIERLCPKQLQYTRHREKKNIISSFFSCTILRLSFSV